MYAHRDLCRFSRWRSLCIQGIAQFGSACFLRKYHFLNLGAGVRDVNKCRFYQYLRKNRYQLNFVF